MKAGNRSRKGFAGVLLAGVLGLAVAAHGQTRRAHEATRPPDRSRPAGLVTGPSDSLQMLAGDPTAMNMVIELRPMSNYPGGTYNTGGCYGQADILGNTLTIPGGPCRTYWNLFLSNWDPNGDRNPPLSNWQARVDASGYGSGTGVALVPADQTCNNSAACATAFGESGAICANAQCGYAWVNKVPTRTDLFGPDLPAPDCNAPVWDVGLIDPAGPLFLGVNDAEPCGLTDPGVVVYGGSIALDVPSGAEGTYTIPFIAGETFATDPNLFFIPLAVLVSGTLVIHPCTGPADCPDDGEFCNGTESCNLGTGRCTHSGSPCVSPTPFCDEGPDVCFGCTGPADCPDNGEFCDGVESCDLMTGFCTDPYDPCASPTPFCDEGPDVCFGCTGPADCPGDGVFCNGNEFCNLASGFCEQGGSPCTANQICDEGAGACVDFGACCLDMGAVCFETNEPDCVNPPPQGAGGVFLGPESTCPEQNAMIVPEGDGTVFIHVIGPPVDCPLPRPARSAQGCPPSGPYFDPWVSDENAGLCHNFGSPETDPIPSDFFGLGSDPFTSAVCLRGAPLGIPQYGNADTLILRSADPFDRCDLPSATLSTVDIEIADLSLESIAPITVTYNGGSNPEAWDVAVDLSPGGLTPGTPQGTLTATKSTCNGGAYTSTLYVQPRFTFRKVGSPNEVRVLDTGSAGTPPVELVQSDPHPWVGEVDPFLGAMVDLCSAFHANIDDGNPTLECDCNGNLRRDLCDIEECAGAAACSDCNGNGVPDGCDISSAASPDTNPANGVPDECEMPSLVVGDPTSPAEGRFLGLVVQSPMGIPGQQTALRITLSLLNHPRHCCAGQDESGFGAGCNVNAPCNLDSNCSGPTPLCRPQSAPGVPDYSSFEGKIRYVNSFPGGSLVCADDGPPFDTSYRCATLGCDPEYRDWTTDLAVAVNPGALSGLLYVTGDAMIPSSTVRVEHIAASCGAPPAANTCTAASTPLVVRTSAWGDITSAAFGLPDGKHDVLDIPAVTNKLKGVPAIFPEYRVWLKQRDPEAHMTAITVVDLSDVQDAVLAKPYPASRTIDACGHD